jgi:glycosyltransferase involved in cell wall biosynthesis
LFKVSVIIPVYNAAQFVEQAVLSALNQSQTGEVLLIEDASKDNSLQVCKKLELIDNKVKLYTHPNGMNKGASESRNLGIKLAKFDYIAFLDADDLYNEGRFDAVENYFTNNNQIDGVYECAQYLNEEKLYTINRDIPPDKLLLFLLRGTYGHFHTNAITLKRAVFEKVGFFNPKLKLHQDTELWLRIACVCKLVAGNIRNPVAFIRQHEGNRIWRDANNQTRFEAYIAFLQWSKNFHVGFLEHFFLFRKLLKLFSLYKNVSFIRSLLPISKIYLMLFFNNELKYP